jgi:uncharacterized protein YlxP (DUF503 family)
MVIGVCSWELSLPECRSLKEKRKVVKSLKERLQQRFRVSVAETSHQDTWTRAQLTAAVVAADAAQADSILDKLDRFVEGDGRALIVGVDRSFR